MFPYDRPYCWVTIQYKYHGLASFIQLSHGEYQAINLLDVGDKTNREINYLCHDYVLVKGTVTRFSMGVHVILSSSGRRFTLSFFILIFSIPVAATVGLMVSRISPKWILNLDVQTGSGFDYILKSESGSDLTLKTGSGWVFLLFVYHKGSFFLKTKFYVNKVAACHYMELKYRIIFTFI